MMAGHQPSPRAFFYNANDFCYFLVLHIDNGAYFTHNVYRITFLFAFAFSFMYNILYQFTIKFNVLSQLFRKLTDFDRNNRKRYLLAQYIHLR